MFLRAAYRMAILAPIGPGSSSKCLISVKFGVARLAPGERWTLGPVELDMDQGE